MHATLWRVLSKTFWKNFFYFLIPSQLSTLNYFALTGFSGPDFGQSHRIHPVDEEEKSHPPAGHWWFKEAERTAGATGYVEESYSWWLLLLTSLHLPPCVTWFSPCPGESQRELSAPNQLLLWQQLVHKPQRQRGVGLRRRVRLHLWIGAGWAAQQEEAACGNKLDSWWSRRTFCIHQLFLPAFLLTPVKKMRWKLS